jgi:hypothetical protein
MDSSHPIAVLLREWLELTRSESHAIQFGRWNEVAQIQKSKSTLQKPLISAIEQWKAGNPSEAATNPFHVEVSRLLELEARTSELLAVRKREVREKILLLEQALYDLRRNVPARAAASQVA